MAMTGQQILNAARDIELKTRKGKGSFVIVPVDDFPRLRECVESTTHGRKDP